MDFERGPTQRERESERQTNPVRSPVRQRLVEREEKEKKEKETRTPVPCRMMTAPQVVRAFCVAQHRVGLE